METIYLAGQICEDKGSHVWREGATEILEAMGFGVINPAANHFNRELMGRTENNGEEFLRLAIEQSQGILIDKDHALVKKSDIVLVNLQTFPSFKPMVGTLFELAWCYDDKRPVIGITDDGPYSRHPFIQRTLSGKAASVLEACRLIERLYCVAVKDPDKRQVALWREGLHP